MGKAFFQIRDLVPRLLIAIAVGWWLAACSPLTTLTGDKPKLEKPSLSVVDVQPARKGKPALLEPRLRVRVKVENPNPVELPIGGIECRLEMQGMDFATGRTTDFFVIPAHGATEFDLEVSTELNKAMKQLSALLRKKELSADYRLSGRIHVEIPFIGAVPFEKSGTLQRAIRWDE